MWHAIVIFYFILLFVSLPIRLLMEGSFKDLNGTCKLIYGLKVVKIKCRD